MTLRLNSLFNYPLFLLLYLNFAKMNYKSICLLFLLFTFKIISAQQAHYPDKPNIHGMLLMGMETIYAEHLPMFHQPHDYQIILELEFSKADLEQYRTSRLAFPEEFVYTIEPEVFVLPEMVNKTKVFKANVYRGHFERGGFELLDSISLKIKQVVYYKQFDKDNPRPVDLQYILFGNMKEQFLSHLISRKPDFHEVLSVKLSDVKQMKTDKSYQLLVLKERENRVPFSWGKSKAMILGTKRPVSFINHKQLYVEFGDLE